jgi:hypothetical protein
MEFALIPLVLVFTVQWHVRRRFPMALSLLIGAYLIVLTPVKSEFRERSWRGEGAGAGLMGRLRIWWEAGFDVVSAERQGLEEHDSIGETMSRVDLLHKFAYVQTMTPEEVPYLGGRSYEYFLYTFIPRFVWPDKPEATMATDLVDFVYKLRSEVNVRTNMGIGQIAEAYANFGWQGIFGVFFLQGLFFAFIDNMLNSSHSYGGRAIYLSIMVMFLNGVGTSAVILFGSVIQIMIGSAILMRPFALGFAFHREDARLNRKQKLKAEIKKAEIEPL